MANSNCTNCPPSGHSPSTDQSSCHLGECHCDPQSQRDHTDKPDINDEIRRLQKVQALLIAVQFAANHEAEFDVSDAVAAIIAMVEQSLDGLDQLEGGS